MNIEELSATIASLADKLSNYHSRLMTAEREIEHLKEVKNGEVKSSEAREQLQKT